MRKLFLEWKINISLTKNPFLEKAVNKALIKQHLKIFRIIN